MGIIQAKEAVSMSLEERMANFLFLYDDDGPHLNPHIMEKLKPKLGIEMTQETESRLHPDLPSLLVDSTSTGKKKGTISSKETPQVRTTRGTVLPGSSWKETH